MRRLIPCNYDRSGGRFRHAIVVGCRTTTLAMLLVLSLLATSVQARQAAPPKHVSDDAVILLTVRYADAANQTIMQLLPHEVFNLAGEKELGVDLTKLERVSMVVEPFDDLIDPPNFAFVMEFSEDQTPGGRAINEMIQGEVDGRTIWTPPFGGGDDIPSLIEIDAKTYLFAMPDIVEKSIAGLTNGRMTQLLNSIPANDHADLYLDIAGMREFIRTNLPPKDNLPEMFSRYYDILDLASSITAREGYADGGVAELVIQANNEADAEKLARLLVDAIDLGKQAGLSGLAFTPFNEIDPEYQGASLEYATRVTENLKEAIAASVDGDKLVIDLRKTMKTSGVAIAGVAIGMLLPAVQQVREAARRTTSMNNLRQICLASHNYESAMGEWPAQAICDDDGNPLLSWRVAILPYIEQNDLYEEFHLDEPWDSEHNIQLLDRIPEVYVCPNFDLGPDTVYLGVSGENMVFNGNERVDFGDIVDGSSNTIVFVEANPEASVPWSKPADLVVDADWPTQNLGGVRPGGFSVAMMDGSVHFMSQFMDDQNLMNLFQYNDGEVVDWLP